MTGSRLIRISEKLYKQLDQDRKQAAMQTGSPISFDRAIRRRIEADSKDDRHRWRLNI